MSRTFDVAVVGATGAVGEVMLAVDDQLVTGLQSGGDQRLFALE